MSSQRLDVGRFRGRGRCIRLLLLRGLQPEHVFELAAAVLPLVAKRKPPIVHASNDERTRDAQKLAGGVGRKFAVERDDDDAGIAQHDPREFADQLEHYAFELNRGRALAGRSLKLSCNGPRLLAATVTDAFKFRRREGHTSLRVII